MISTILIILAVILFAYFGFAVLSVLLIIANALAKAAGILIALACAAGLFILSKIWIVSMNTIARMSRSIQRASK